MKRGEKSTIVGSILQSGLSLFNENMYLLILFLRLSVIYNYNM
jgi:hypothetical protein